MKKIIDLSLPFENASDEEKDVITKGLQPEIEYFSHEITADTQRQTYGLEPEQWPLGPGWEIIKTVAHGGTHIDAPWHFSNKTLNGEKKAMTADELPLEWFDSDAFVLDFSYIENGGQVSIEQMKKAIEDINYDIKERDIVLFRFDHDKRYGTADYWNEWPGVSADAMKVLLEKGVKVFGTDSLGQDHTFSKSKALYEETGDLKYVWEAHQLGKEYEFCNIEKMTNLDLLPAHGFKVISFPIKIKGASGAWTRPVAIIDGE